MLSIHTVIYSSRRRLAYRDIGVIVHLKGVDFYMLTHLKSYTVKGHGICSIYTVAGSVWDFPHGYTKHVH